MTDRPTRSGPLGPLVFGLLAALGAVVAIVSALSHSSTGTAVGLVVLGGSALAAYRAARTAEARTDHLVLQRLQQDPALDEPALAAALGLRPAAVRLSLHRLSQRVSLPQPEGKADDGN